jgi:peroxiredoxin
MPVLQATYDQFRQGGFQVVAINIGEPLQQVEAFIRQGGLTFAVWSDPTEESLRAFKTISLPSSFVLDRHGIVRHVWFGEVCADSLQGEIAALLISDEVTSP